MDTEDKAAGESRHNNNYSICFLRHFELNETVQIGCQRGISRWNPFEACRPKIDEAVVAEVAILVVDDGMILVVVAITARDVVFVADAVVMDTEDKAAGESRSVNEVLYGRDMGFQHSTIERKILKLILKRGVIAMEATLSLVVGLRRWMRWRLLWWWTMLWRWWSQ
ncbi:hypothetical protein S83_027092 [Arachis hypogaea]